MFLGDGDDGNISTPDQFKMKTMDNATSLRWGEDGDNRDGGNRRRKKRGKKKGRHCDDNRFEWRFDPVLDNVININATCYHGKDKRVRGDGPACAPAAERAPLRCLRQYSLARRAPSNMRPSFPMK
jgi:hypothetical protein